MGIPQEKFTHYQNFRTSVFNGTAVSVPLHGSFFTNSALGERMFPHSSSVHGQSSHFMSSGVLATTSECGWLGAFNIIFSPIGLFPFLKNNVANLRTIQDMSIDAGQFLSNIELLREQLQEVYSQELRKAVVQNPAHHDSLKYPERAWVSTAVMMRLVGIAEQFLVRLLAASTSQTHTLQESQTERSVAQAEYICRRLTVTHGNLSIEALGNELGITTRQILNIMNTVVGVSAKTYAERERFIYAMQLLQKGVGGALMQEREITEEIDRETRAENARRMFTRHIHTAIHHAGYYDQSHCIRDFQRFAGITPLEFVRPQQEAFF